MKNNKKSLIFNYNRFATDISNFVMGTFMIAFAAVVSNIETKNIGILESTMCFLPLYTAGWYLTNKSTKNFVSTHTTKERKQFVKALTGESKLEDAKNNLNDEQTL